MKAVGSKIYSTAQDGTIVVTTNGSTYSINAKELIPPKVNPVPSVTEPVKESNTSEPFSQPELTPTKKYFKNCTELNKVYPNGVDSSHPAYERKWMEMEGLVKNKQ